MVRAADAAAQLVQLREAELVGAIDDDRVGGRDVDAALDDRRADQHVEPLVIEVEHHLLELALATSGRGRRRCALRAAARRSRARCARWSRRGCARSRSARRGGSRAGTPRGSSRTSHSPTNVLIDRRAAGGVAMIDRSRKPPSAMFNVRGIGVAVSVSMSTSARSRFSRSLSFTPKRCSSSMISKPEPPELHAALQQLVRADHDVDLARLQALQHLLDVAARCGSATALRPCTGQSAKRSANVW